MMELKYESGEPMFNAIAITLMCEACKKVGLTDGFLTLELLFYSSYMDLARVFLEGVRYEEWRAFRVGGGFGVSALRARDSTLEERQEAREVSSESESFDDCCFDKKK
jgi:hypothetical protein